MAAEVAHDVEGVVVGAAQYLQRLDDNVLADRVPGIIGTGAGALAHAQVNELNLLILYAAENEQRWCGGRGGAAQTTLPR